MDRFHDLDTFVRVVEAGSITGAAERLDTAKSAVSRRLKELERRLGVQLFHRTTRRLTLTDTGRGFYERAVRILADLKEAEDAVSRAHGSVRGRIRVAAPLSFGLTHLNPAIVDFMQMHPEVDFDLDFNDRMVDLVREGLDVAIRIAELSDSSLIARPLAPVRSLVCASPRYLARNGTPKTPEDLSRHPALVYSNAPDPQVWRYRDRTGAEGSVKVPVRLRANNGDFLRDAAIAGQGLCLEPNFIVYRAVAEGLLTPVLTAYEWPTVNAYAVYPPTRHLSSRVRVFVDFLVQRFTGTPYWDQGLDRPERGSPDTSV